MTADRSKPKQVTGRLKTALDLMVWEGAPYDEAAKAVGLAARSMRKALERPHVLAYLAAGKKQLRASESARILRRLVILAHQDDNKNAAVAACRAVEHIPEEEGPRHGQAQVPGFVIVLREQQALSPAGAPVVIEAAPEPRAVASPVRQISSDVDR
jgi:hypothetical protein